MTTYRDYVEHGWQLCPIREGEKLPRGRGWNTLAKAINEPERAVHLDNAGLLHAFSGTCAIDIDNIDLARHWLKKRDIDLDELMRAPDAVRIHSGDVMRGKLIYALPIEDGMTPTEHAQRWPTKQIKSDDKTLMLLEFRCGATTGNSVQDVLPPSMNPRTKIQYAWHYNADLLGDWRELPPLPDSLRKLWRELVDPSVDLIGHEKIEARADFDELRETIWKYSPDCAYDEWTRIGMVIHHETDGDPDGLALWDEWSAQAEGRYKGIEDCQSHWDSFGHAALPATIGSLRREQVATKDDFESLPGIGGVSEEAAQRAEKREAAIKSKFHWLRPGELMNRPPPVWLVKQILPRAELNMIYGPSGSGKSFAVLDMALAIVRGIAWRDFAVKQGQVGWIAAEAFSSMRNRLRAYCKLHEIERNALDGFFVLGTNVDLSEADHVREIIESAKPLNLQLIVVDTLAAATPASDENDGKDMGLVLDNCAYIHRRTDASVLLVHHSGKDETKGARGSTKIKARVEAELHVVKRPGTNLSDLIPTKLRDGNKEGEVYPFALREVSVGTDEDGELITSAAVTYTEQQNSTRPAPKLQGKANSLALSILESLWPVDGDPDIKIDSFYAAYCDNQLADPTGAGKDTRMKEAHTILRRLTNSQVIAVDNPRGELTLLNRAGLSPRVSEPDVDEDLI